MSRCTDEPMIHVATPAEKSMRAVEGFEHRYQRLPEAIAFAPGRVNLIGEHVDYCEGFVLPMAIDRHMVVAGARRTDSTIRVFSEALGEELEIRAGSDGTPLPGWAPYIRGVIQGFRDAGIEVSGFDAYIYADLPVGSGLSSSAALEVSMATLIEGLVGIRLPAVAKALLCLKAEQVYAGVPCGIMDQFASVFGREDHLLLIDCRSREIEYVPFLARNVSILITNTKVRHELTGGEYADRKQACERVTRALNVESLRCVSPTMLEAGRAKLEASDFLRAHHVVTEIDRTRQAVAAIRAEEWDEVGRLMNESHRSLRYDYEVSCDELDEIVDTATRLGKAEGVYGCRMTGGGFGGCCVALVQTPRAEAIASAIRSAYAKRFGTVPETFITRPSEGASLGSQPTATRFA